MPRTVWHVQNVFILRQCQKVCTCFQPCILDHLKVGNLLSCSVNGISKPLIFFLGICLKRPTLHVLIHATIDSNGLCTFKTGQAGQLDISTSCQWFCKILKRKPETEKIQVEVLEYSALLSSQNQRMEVHANSCAAKTFTIDLHTPYKPFCQIQSYVVLLDFFGVGNILQIHIEPFSLGLECNHPFV